MNPTDVPRLLIVSSIVLQAYHYCCKCEILCCEIYVISFLSNCNLMGRPAMSATRNLLKFSGQASL